MLIPRIIQDYIKRFLVCFLAVIAVPLGAALNAVLFYLYCSAYPQNLDHPVTLANSFQFFFGAIGLFGMFMAFPILAFYAATINTVLFMLKKDNFYTVVVVPLILFNAITASGFLGEHFFHGKGLLLCLYYSTVCGISYWYCIKLYGLTSQSHIALHNTST